MHDEQSSVGKVLSNCAIRPPILGVFSTRYTLNPSSAKSKDACIPAIPPPTTNASGITGIVDFSNEILNVISYPLLNIGRKVVFAMGRVPAYSSTQFIQ